MISGSSRMKERIYLSHRRPMSMRRKVIIVAGIVLALYGVLTLCYLLPGRPEAVRPKDVDYDAVDFIKL